MLSHKKIKSVILWVYTQLQPECWKDDASDGNDEAKKDRIFDYRVLPDSQTLLQCAVNCGNAGYKYMGYQSQNQCFCGTADDNYKKYGQSDDCKDGKGGQYVASIYSIDSGKSQLQLKFTNEQEIYDKKLWIHVRFHSFLKTCRIWYVASVSCEIALKLSNISN